MTNLPNALWFGRQTRPDYSDQRVEDAYFTAHQGIGFDLSAIWGWASRLRRANRPTLATPAARPARHPA